MTHDHASAATTVSHFLDTLTAEAGFRLSFVIAPDPVGTGLKVTFDGQDTPLLTEGWGELLDALQHVTVQALHLAPGEQMPLCFAVRETSRIVDRSHSVGGYFSGDTQRPVPNRGESSLIDYLDSTIGPGSRRIA